MQNKVARQRVADWMQTPANGAPVQISAQDLLTDYLLPNGLSSIVVVDMDGRVRGVARLDRIMAQPRERWAHLPVASIMHPLSPDVLLKPDDSLDHALDVATTLDDPLSALPVAVDGRLVGEVPVNTLRTRVRRLLEVSHGLSATIRLSIGERIVDRQGRVIGKLTRVAVNPSTWQVTHLIVRMQDREVAVMREAVQHYDDESVRLHLDAEALDAYPDFLVVHPEQPVHQHRRIEHRGLRGDALCLDALSRVTVGPRAVGRLTGWEISDRGEVQYLRYTSGREGAGRIPRDAVLSSSDDLVEVEPAALAATAPGSGAER